MIVPMRAKEWNLDGLPGPTHNYAGLSYGNLASTRSRGSISHPRAAALEGLAKMKLVADLGIPQAILPPQIRPDLAMLRALGFEGSEKEIVLNAHRADPALLTSCYSSSAMWAANAATVSPSSDAADRKPHITPANLVSRFHRSLEATQTAAQLRSIFDPETGFAHHAALTCSPLLADEGAANHTRLCAAFDQPGVQLFVYGRDGFDDESEASAPPPTRYPARHTLQASQAIARLHKLDPNAVVFARQSAIAIDAGVFHNDVIAVGNQNVLLYHAQAFVEEDRVIGQLQQCFQRICGQKLILLRIDSAEMSLAAAVKTYFFNSQLLTLPNGMMTLIAPIECQEDIIAQTTIGRLLFSGGPIKSVHYVDLRQSMQNGGGPACLRLRMVLTEREQSAMHPGVIFNEALYGKLVPWVNSFYRNQLSPDDLSDPRLLVESREAHSSLQRILWG